MNRVSPNFLRVLPQEFWVLTKGAINSKRHHVLPAVLGRSPALSHYTVRMSSLSTSRTFNIRTVDVRTDSVTRIGAAMHRAMAGTEFEKGPLGEDLRVKELQKMAADMFGMEAALLVPSGTMSNLIAVMVHCRERGDEMIVGDLSHMRIYEQGGSAQLAGVHSMPVTTLLDGTFDLDQLVSNIRHDYPKPFYPRSRLICLENTHNIMGGRVLPPSFLQEVRAITDRHGLAVHMDGARLMNAAVALGVSPRTILQHVDSVSVSLCKGLGAPVGSLLCGSQDFISRAIRCRKALGGGMRQAGILAAAGKLALEDMVLRLEEDHRNAKTFAKALWECDSSLFHVDMDSVETNIVCFRLCDPSLSPSEFCDHMAQIWRGEEVALQQGVRVLMLPFFGGIVRGVWHVGVNAEDTQMAIKKLQFVARQYSNNKQNNRLQ